MGVGVGRGRVEVGWGRERSVGSGGCMVRYGVCIGGQRRLGRELEEKRSWEKREKGGLEIQEVYRRSS